MKNRGIGFSKAVDFNDEGILFEERELEMPELCSQFDVIVRVLATAINPVDIKMAEAYQAHEFTVLGFDGVGDIVSVGEAVSDFAIGERV